MKNATLAAEVANYYFSKVGSVVNVKGLLENGVMQAHWPGRFEVVSSNPLFIIDGAHNEDAARQLAQTVENCFTNRCLTYIIGVLADKEHEKMLQLMSPYAQRVYTVTPDNARALSATALAVEAKKYYPEVVAVESVEQAIRLALEHEDAILAFGSLSYLGDLKSAFNHHCRSGKQD